MRLLQYSDNGELCFTENFVGKDPIPPYAILSHRWGADTEEPTFEELINGTGQKKLGYKKLQFCGEQARQNDLQHFWVDTCCINKSDFTELSEAINSMFRWYRNATRCYVYLSDVSSPAFDINNGKYNSRPWESDFRKSNWFTRGWTLQELLAPSSVEFFSRERKRIGDKRSVEQLLHEITSIPISALRGTDLSQFGVEERLSWIKRRHTKREEDKAYSLLGIFDIHMPLLYGEGEEKALKRLKATIQIEKEDREYIQHMHLNDAYDDKKRITDIEQRVRLPEKKINELTKWLCAPDPSSNYQKAKKQRQDGTGLWFLEGEQYAQFKVGTSQFVWLHGIPGCGKSVLSSTILDDLFQFCQPQTGYVVAYFYFDFSDPQKQVPELMVRSIIAQLIRRCNTIPSSLDAFFSQYQGSKQQPSADAYFEAMKELIQDFRRVYLVLDALDECGSKTKLTGILTAMTEWRMETLQFLVTSRKERDIERCLEDLVERKCMISLQSQIIDRDIQLHIRERLCKDKDLQRWRKDRELQDDIEKTLLNGAHGMFRWATCQLDTLAKCVNRAMLRESLATLPSTLDETYERILRSILGEHSQYAVRILRWLSFSARPLLLHEIAEAAAIDPKREAPFDKDEVLEDPWDVLDICSSLVMLTTISSGKIPRSNTQQPQECQAVVLAHYSVQEYLSSIRCLQGPMAQYGATSSACHAFIASSCLGYLQRLDNTDFFNNNRVEDVKLGLYSAEFWTHHAREATTDKHITRQALALLSKSSAAYCNWIRMHDPESPWNGCDVTRDLNSIPEPLYYACLEGLAEVADHLITIDDADVNVRGKWGNSALYAASKGGYDKIVQQLLAKGAEVNGKDRGYDNALYVASYEGHDKVVEVLLAGGADVNAQDRECGNALYVASDRGHEKVVKVLLAGGADVNAQDRECGNALYVASARGHYKIVELLLAKGANVNARGKYNDSFEYETRNFYYQGGDYDNALYAASKAGHDKIVEALLARGANVNTRGGYYGNALQAASYQGHDKIVEALLANGANVNAEGGEYGYALHAASNAEHDKIVEVLLAAGADVNAEGGFYGDVLLAANSSKVVKILLANGAKRTP